VIFKKMNGIIKLTRLRADANEAFVQVKSGCGMHGRSNRLFPTEGNGSNLKLFSMTWEMKTRLPSRAISFNALCGFDV
jgi:hypothetical protein